MHLQVRCTQVQCKNSCLFFCLSYHKGKELGSILGMPLAGVLCASDIWGGWPSVFYVFGKYFPCNTVNKDPSSWVYLIVNDDISMFRDISSGGLDITDI